MSTFLNANVVCNGSHASLLHHVIVTGHTTAHGSPATVIAHAVYGAASRLSPTDHIATLRSTYPAAPACWHSWQAAQRMALEAALADIAVTAQRHFAAHRRSAPFATMLAAMAVSAANGQRG
jgi:hypothetical protein